MSEEKSFTPDDVDNAFRTGEVYNAPNDVLREYLRVLNTQGIPNERVRHRATNRCITINTIINMNFVKSVERSNNLIVIAVAFMTIWIATCTCVATIANVWATMGAAKF